MEQRKLAYEILSSSLIDGKYTALLMKNSLNKLPRIQRAFVTELVNGVLRHYFELQAQFKDDAPKISLKLSIILSMALYERFFMHQKDYVINSEYPDLVNKKGEKAFISAILHKKDRYQSFDGSSDEELSIHYSIPLWMIKLLKKQYSQEEFETIINDVNQIPRVYYRLNKTKASMDVLKKYQIEILNDEIFTSKENLINTKEFEQGLFYIQDINSAKLCHYLDLQKGMKLLDVCSAPGGKLFNALDILNPSDVYANDLHAHRLKLIELTANKLGFEGINYLNYDGTIIHEKLKQSFDRILLDVPCSGLGVLKRKPDLRYHIKPENLDELQVVQAKLLDSASKLLKNEGILVYSTCTINKKENANQIKQFLNSHPDFELLDEKTLLHEDGGDSFYVAKLQKA